MKTQAELTELLDFIGEYATYLLGSGVHTSRVVRNARRIGASQSVDVRLTTFQRTSILTVREEGNPQVVTQVVEIPHLPISFERNSDLSSLSWEAVDRRLPHDAIREKFRKLTAKPRMDPMFVLMVVGLANASFCKLFNGDWVAVGIVFTSTLAGFSARQQLTKAGVNHFIIFILSASSRRCARSSVASRVRTRDGRTTDRLADRRVVVVPFRFRSGRPPSVYYRPVVRRTTTGPVRGPDRVVRSPGFGTAPVPSCRRT